MDSFERLAFWCDEIAERIERGLSCEKNAVAILIDCVRDSHELRIASRQCGFFDPPITTWIEHVVRPANAPAFDYVVVLSIQSIEETESGWQCSSQHRFNVTNMTPARLRDIADRLREWGRFLRHECELGDRSRFCPKPLMDNSVRWLVIHNPNERVQSMLMCRFRSLAARYGVPLDRLPDRGVRFDSIVRLIGCKRLEDFLPDAESFFARLPGLVPPGPATPPDGNDAVTGGGSAVSGGRSGEQQRADNSEVRPAVLLTNWREITNALEMKCEEQDKVKSLNERFKGPIPKPRKGSQPVVDKATLLDWWNSLAVRQQELANHRDSKQLIGEISHAYGRDGKVFPEISGAEKKRRSDFKG